MPPRLLISCSENRSDRSVSARILTAIMFNCSARSRLIAWPNRPKPALLTTYSTSTPAAASAASILSQASRFAEIAGNNDRGSAAGGGDFGGEFGQTIFAPRDQCHAMAVRSKNTRQLRAYARRGAGNQRYTLSHDSLL